MQLDPKNLLIQLGRAKTDFPWRTKDGLEGYEALGLQYSVGPDIYADAVNIASAGQLFRMHEKRNPAGERFDSVFLRLLPARLFRSRLLTIASGFEMSDAHKDGAASVRLHIPIETNPEAWFEIDGRRYHLPADGSAYLVNTSRLHRIGNPGSTKRTHLVSIVYPTFPSLIHPLAQASMIRFVEEVMKGNRAVIGAMTAAALKEAQGHCEACGQARKLYGVPISQSELKATCAQCIENAGRKSSAIDQFEAELGQSIRSRV